MQHERTYDVIVVGAGHAGVEAALAAARMGCSALLVTQNLDTIGLMSCNPAVGGIGKGQLVRELDAMGGAMGQLTDKAGIHFRQLNTSKGRAVRSSRAQVDRQMYRRLAKQLLEGADEVRSGKTGTVPLSACVRLGAVQSPFFRRERRAQSRSTKGRWRG